MYPVLPARVVLVALFCAALAACGSDATPQRGPQTAAKVTTTVLALQPWSDTIRALGTVKARESVTVTAKVSETVQAVHFDSGDEVEAGTPLVELTGNQQRAMLEQAQATAEEAARLYSRQDNLAMQGVIPRASLDAQRAVRDYARARVEEMRAALADRVIRAPFTGMLGIRQVSPGALVTPGTPIATLDDISHVYVDFPVPEDLFASLAVGQQLTATAAAYPAREFAGVVSTIDSRIDPLTRAVNVRGEFVNADRALRPGMLLQVTLIRPPRQALLVPEISIVQVGNSAFVYRVQADEVVERADVEVGSRRGGLAEVTAGLAVGDRIVVDGTGKLRPGDRVDAVPAQAAAATDEPATPATDGSAHED
ncbi:efflux RND transporter periplasmic adaptor subunit [Dokdonella sp.]|uniref:efflux RND transporter periplasmic adaptor subunit n=1 Tax=Dokdonella sp. TaxID=2291710 RepID=UPI0031CB55D7|nr:efflux RND transporter periplasmic adaptor subunit [Dokdonella sp.]